LLECHENKIYNFFLTVVSVFLFCNCNYPGEVSAKTAEKGTVDLGCTHEKDGHNEQGLVALEGEWEFYGNQFLTSSGIAGKEPAERYYHSVPDNWKYGGEHYDPWKGGYGTYCLKVTVSDPEMIYGLKLERVYSAYRLYIDDKFIGSDGLISTEKAGFVPGLSSKIFFSCRIRRTSALFFRPVPMIQRALEY
jgi:hypothetical protein